MNKEKDSFGGFTLVEVLVVMAIIAVLIGISIAGLGFAMRRSRNIARQAATQNIDRANEAFYSDNNYYPSSGAGGTLAWTNWDTFVGTTLNEYLEGAWDAPTDSKFFYMSDGLVYTVCTNQETFPSGEDYVCTGPGLGSGDNTFPVKDEVCDATSCGECEEYDGAGGWGVCSF